MKLKRNLFTEERLAPADGPGQEMSVEQFVCGMLRAEGIQAHYEYPGWISVDGKLNCWAIGTANPEWSMDLTENDGKYIDSFGLGFHRDSQDLTGLVAEIKATLDLGYQDIPVRFLKLANLCEDRAEEIGRRREEEQKAFDAPAINEDGSRKDGSR